MSSSEYRTTRYAEPFDDRPLQVSKRCRQCAHLNREEAGFSCAAFPQGIPQEIVQGKFDHVKPYPGDGGIVFRAMTDEEREELYSILAD